MSVSKAHSRASTRYNRSRDNIMLRPDKTEGARIRAAAAAAGLSVQRYILDTIRPMLPPAAPDAGDDKTP